MCWLRIWSAVLNLMGLVWIPWGCVTKWGWLVNWLPTPFNQNHSHSHAALKYDSCNWGIGLGTYLLSRGRVMHISYFGTHFFTAVVTCTPHARPQAFADVLTFKQSSLHVSYALLCWPCLWSMLLRGISCYKNPIGFLVAASPSEIQANIWVGLQPRKKVSAKKES